MTEHNNQQDCKSYINSHNRPEKRIRITSPNSKVPEHDLHGHGHHTNCREWSTHAVPQLIHYETDPSIKIQFLYTKEREWKSIYTVAIKSSTQIAKTQEEHNYNLNETKHSLFYWQVYWQINWNIIHKLLTVGFSNTFQLILLLNRIRVWWTL